MAKLRKKSLVLLLLLAVIGLSFAKTGIHLLTEAWWFDSIGFSSVFWTRLAGQVGIWIVTFAIYFLFLWGNYRLACSWTRDRPFRLLEGSQLEDYGEVAVHYGVLLAISLIALSAANASISAWENLFKFLHPSEFGSRDPIFGRDISFYIFKLPLYEGLRQWLLGLLLSTLFLSASVYGLKGNVQAAGSRPTRTAKSAKAHLSLLIGAIALWVAWGFWLARYQLLYSRDGAVFGAGYTAIHARLFACGVLGSFGVLAALLFWFSAQRRSWALPLLGVGLFVPAFVLLNWIYPAIVQQFIVAPNELAKERPYLVHNIQLTRAAYRLNEVQTQNFAAKNQLNRAALQANEPTIRNIRLWDYRPLLSTYRQLQEIRLYYEFLDVDIDRYTLNKNYRQVMLSARELSFNRVPQEAQTWVNRHLKYTHGYGLVMSPVNQVTADGLPELLIQDIPPVSKVDLEVKQPAIYYGEGTDNYIFTDTTTQEFDYAAGGTNTLTSYEGTGGVPLSSIGRRLAYACDFGSLRFLISNYLTDRSRLHYYRQIRERVKQVAPFLRFDSDPYLVLLDGRLQWIVDAFTVSDRYPYSEPVAPARDAITPLNGDNLESLVREKVNYIRNSVKVLIDARDGTLRFFVVDETDPVLATYRKIFPQLFEPRTAIPAIVKAHFRYPLDLFKFQAQVYLSYHMSDPEAFYNREDLWQYPIQTYEGTEQTMDPYYMIVRLPGEEKEGFIAILPFTPASKDNMIAWMAARSNGQEYGRLLLYEFPKQKLIYGPRQIEARIDQDPNISQQFTLWSQSGSKVIRGDLLVIPVEQSLLYIEPVYLRAEKGELPELKRVIVVYGQSIAMEETLEKSLSAIFGGEERDKIRPHLEKDAGSVLAKSALLIYEKAQEALRQGKWAEYGRYQQELEQRLQQLNESPRHLEAK
jgi:uncharacterized membrane protein (UPF0182 family)